MKRLLAPLLLALSLPAAAQTMGLKIIFAIVLCEGMPISSPMRTGTLANQAAIKP